jgi:hypothetical protein
VFVIFVASEIGWSRAKGSVDILWAAVSELPAKQGSGNNEAFWKNRRTRDFESLRAYSQTSFKPATS